MVANAEDINTNYEELKEFHAELLRSNYEKTSITALVRITEASIYEEIPPIYTRYIFKCEVIEIFKGPDVKEIEYIRFMETLSNNNPRKYVGKTSIISAFYNKEKNQYQIDDNGYDLPDTPFLLNIARELASK